MNFNIDAGVAELADALVSDKNWALSLETTKWMLANSVKLCLGRQRRAKFLG